MCQLKESLTEIVSHASAAHSIILTYVVCERYALLPNDKKAMIAGELDRSVREIERKVSVSNTT